MKRHIIPILLTGFLCFSTFPAIAQTEQHYYPVDKTSLDGSRYEIVVPSRDESPSIFKLDKYTGDVWVLPNSIGSNKLTLLTREPSENDIAEEGKVNYQLLSVSSSRVYLLNLNTGILWEYTIGLFSRRDDIFRMVEEK